MVVFRILFGYDGDSGIELQCYSETRVMSLFIVGSFPRVRTMVRFWCLGRIMELIGICFDFESCCHVRVSASCSSG